MTRAPPSSWPSWTDTAKWSTELVAEDRGEVQLCISRLQAAFHGGGDQRLGLSGLHTFAKQVRVAAKILDGRESDRVDAILNGRVTDSGESRDPASKGVDELVELTGRQRAVDPNF